MLIRHEGYKTRPYKDTLGNITIGIGYNLDARGLPDAWINRQYDEDVAFFAAQLAKHHPCFSTLNEVRQCVLIDMAFMGYKRLAQFYKMFNALEQRDYDTAADEMLNSYWAQQVPNRAKELAELMRSGKWKE